MKGTLLLQSDRYYSVFQDSGDGEKIVNCSKEKQMLSR